MHCVHNTTHISSRGISSGFHWPAWPGLFALFFFLATADFVTGAVGITLPITGKPKQEQQQQVS